jgi:hypothetical protein
MIILQTLNPIYNTFNVLAQKNYTELHREDTEFRRVKIKKDEMNNAIIEYDRKYALFSIFSLLNFLWASVQPPWTSVLQNEPSLYVVFKCRNFTNC